MVSINDLRAWARRGGDTAAILYCGRNVLGDTGDLFPCSLEDGARVSRSDVPVSIGSQLIKSTAFDEISEPLRSDVGGPDRVIERLMAVNGLCILVCEMEN